jgi:hypothetical protein
MHPTGRATINVYNVVLFKYEITDFNAYYLIAGVRYFSFEKNGRSENTLGGWRFLYEFFHAMILHNFLFN